jgi:hypothetical protein
MARSKSPPLAESIMFWNSGRSSVVALLAWSQNSRTTVMPLFSQKSCMARSCASMDSSRWLSDENRAYSAARGTMPRHFSFSTIFISFLPSLRRRAETGQRTVFQHNAQEQQVVICGVDFLRFLAVSGSHTACRDTLFSALFWQW